MKRLRTTLLFILVASTLAFCLSACGGSGSSASAGADSTAKTALWANVTVRAMDGTVNIQWDNVAGASQPSLYNIYCFTDPSVSDLDPDKRIATGFDGRSFDHTGLNNGTRYYYVITEVTSAGEGPASSVVSATPQASLPAAPFGPKVTALDKAVRLEFTGPTPPAGAAALRYDIYRSVTKSGFTEDNRIATGITFDATTPFTDNGGDTAGGLNNGTTYFYTVKTVSGGLKSAFSPVVAGTPQAAIAAVVGAADTLASFASPTGLWAQAQNGNAVISWTDVPDLIPHATDQVSTKPAYILYWSDSPDVSTTINLGQIQAVKDQQNPTFTHSPLNNGTTYYLLLAAAVKDTNGNITGRQTLGPVVAVTPTLKVPGAPASMAATQIGADQVQIACRKDASGLAGVTYNVYVATTDPGTPADLVAKGTRIYNGASAFFTHSGLKPGTYFYTATAVGDGESAPGAIVSVTLAGP